MWEEEEERDDENGERSGKRGWVGSDQLSDWCQNIRWDTLI